MFAFPRENVLLGEGKGFEISQLRLGPGRIHHCMRAVGAAERAIDLMVDRGLSREGFGKKLINLGKNMEVVSRARIEVEAMRLMVLRAAKAMDTMGNAEARVWVSAVKAMVPQKCCDIINDAIQMHGAAGISQWFPLADMWHHARLCASSMVLTKSTTTLWHGRKSRIARSTCRATRRLLVGSETNRTVEGRGCHWKFGRQLAGRGRSPLGAPAALSGQGPCVT